MKKFTTLFVGLVIALSAVAAPQAGFRAKTAPDLTKLQQFVKKTVRKAPAQANGEVISITANNLIIDDSYNELMFEWLGYGYVSIDASNAEWAVEGSLYPTTQNYFTTYSSAADDISLTVYDAEDNEIELNVASAELKKLENGKQFVATATDDSGNTYNISLSFIVPDEPKDTVVLNFGPATEAEFYASTGDWYFWAENSDYIATLDIYTTDLEGSYTLEDLYTYYCGLYKINGTDTVSVGGFYDANVNIILNAGVYTISADLFMTDSVLYRISMTYVKPVATDTINHSFTEPVSLDDFGGDWYFYAMDNQYLLAMDYYSETPVGEFGLADLYTDYVGMYTIDGTDTTKVAYEDIKIVVTEDETKYNISVTYLGSDLHCYIFTAFSNKATADTTVQVNLENASYTDASEYSWYYGFSHYVLAAPADSSIVFVLAVKDEEFVGSFTEANLYMGYSGVMIGDDQYSIASAEFTVVAGENGSYILTGWLLAKNNVKYEFVIKTAEEGEQAIENTNAAARATKRLVNGQLIIEKNGVQFNVLGAFVK